MESKEIGVDLDNTIARLAPDGSLADPIEGARDALIKLREAGFEVIIFTGRRYIHKSQVRAWLETHGIPYDDLIMGKPVFWRYIGDEAIKHTTWEENLAAIDQERSRADERSRANSRSSD